MKYILMEEKFLLDDIGDILYESFPPILADSGLSIGSKKFFAKEFNIGNNSKQKKISIKDIFDDKYKNGLKVIVDRNLNMKLWIAGSKYGVPGERYRESNPILPGTKDKIVRNYSKVIFDAYYITLDPHSAEQEDKRVERGDAITVKQMKLSNKPIGLDKYGDHIPHIRKRQYSAFPEKETIEQIRNRLKKYKIIVEKKFKELIQKYERAYVESEFDVWKKNIKDFNFGGVNVKKIPDKEKMKELETKEMNNIGEKLKMPTTISTIIRNIENYKDTTINIITSLNTIIGYRDLDAILQELNDKENGIFRSVKDITTNMEKEINRLEKK